MQKTNTITVDLISSEIQDKFIKYCDEYSDLQYTERGRESIELSIMFLNGGYYKDGKHQEYTTEEQADKKAEYEKALPAAEIAAEMAAKELLTLPTPEKQLRQIIKNVLNAQLGIEVTDEDLKNKDFGLGSGPDIYPEQYSLNNKKMQESLSGILTHKIEQKVALEREAAGLEREAAALEREAAGLEREKKLTPEQVELINKKQSILRQQQSTLRLSSSNIINRIDLTKFNDEKLEKFQKEYKSKLSKGTEQYIKERQAESEKYAKNNRLKKVEEISKIVQLTSDQIKRIIEGQVDLSLMEGIENKSKERRKEIIETMLHTFEEINKFAQAKYPENNKLVLSKTILSKEDVAEVITNCLSKEALNKFVNNNAADIQHGVNRQLNGIHTQWLEKDAINNFVAKIHYDVLKHLEQQQVEGMKTELLTADNINRAVQVFTDKLSTSQIQKINMRDLTSITSNALIQQRAEDISPKQYAVIKVDGLSQKAWNEVVRVDRLGDIPPLNLEGVNKQLITEAFKCGFLIDKVVYNKPKESKESTKFRDKILQDKNQQGPSQII